MRGAHGKRRKADAASLVLPLSPVEKGMAGEPGVISRHKRAKQEPRGLGFE